MNKVKVFNEYGEVVALVSKNTNLDYWDGLNFTNGGVGKHKGLTKLRNGSYVVIYGTDWQGERDYAEIIDEDEAFRLILESGLFELFDDHRFDKLKSKYEALLMLEESEDEEGDDISIDEKESEKINIFDIMNRKQFYCCHCDEPVTFTNEDIMNSTLSPVCDGVNFICNECEIEDDISQMYCVFKDGEVMNVEDLFNDYGFYESGFNSFFTTALLAKR